MNILFVYIQPINPIKGGTEWVTYTVANALKKLGHQVYFLATHASSRDSLLYDSEEYILLSKELTNEDQKKGSLKYANHTTLMSSSTNAPKPAYAPSFPINFWVQQKSSPALIWIYTVHHRATPNSKLNRFLHSFLPLFGINPYYFKYYSYYKKIFREAVKVSDAFVVVTPVIGTELQDFIGYKTDKIVSILNPLTSESTKPLYDADKKEKMLLYVGRLSTSKNVNHPRG